MELPDQKDESTLSLPGHDLLALAQQLTGQRVILPKQTLAVHNPETHPTVNNIQQQHQGRIDTK